MRGICFRDKNSLISKLKQKFQKELTRKSRLGRNKIALMPSIAVISAAQCVAQGEKWNSRCKRLLTEKYYTLNKLLWSRSSEERSRCWSFSAIFIASFFSYSVQCEEKNLLHVRLSWFASEWRCVFAPPFPHHHLLSFWREGAACKRLFISQTMEIVKDLLAGRMSTKELYFRTQLNRFPKWT